MAAMLCAAANPMAPVPSANQHTYLLRALAPFEPGLHGDWLARTADAQPLFSGLSFALFWLLGNLGAYLALFGLALLHARGLITVALEFARLTRIISRCTLLSALVFAYSGVIGIGDQHVAGVAAQYALGRVFQPSAFGALLIWSVGCSLEKRFELAVLGCAGAALMHPVYLPHAGLLLLSTVVLAIHAQRQGDSQHPIRIIVCASASGLALITVALFVLLSFDPTHPNSARAAGLLAVERFPHHAMPSEWFREQAIVVFLGAPVLLLLLKDWRLSVLLGPLLAASHLGTLAVGWGGLSSLAPSFPWRSSVVWLPILSVAGAAWLYRSLQRWAWLRVSWVNITLSGLLLAGAAFGTWRVARSNLETWRRDAVLLQAIRQHVPPNGTVLIAPPDLRSDVRLRAGRALFVDWKSHPYRAQDVFEWWHRIALARDVAEQPSAALFHTLEEKYGVTHLLVPAAWAEQAPLGVSCLLASERYALCAL